MSAFRYEQFCPIARAAEVVGERWTLLVIRELFVGPQRFSDLRRRLSGPSSSVLASRLATLEERGLVQRRRMAPPAASTVYELTPAGREFYPAFRSLARWGLQFLTPPRPGDHYEPDWLRLGLDAFRRTDPSPRRRFELRLSGSHGGGRMLSLYLEGGDSGTRIGPAGPPVDLCIDADPLVLLGLVSGRLDPLAAQRDGLVVLEGDVNALADLPKLFDLSTAGPAEVRTDPRTRAPGWDPATITIPD